MTWATFGVCLLEAVGWLWANPFLYLSLIVIALQAGKQIRLERKLFHARLHFLGREVLGMVGWGLMVGLGVSVLLLFMAPGLTFQSMLLLWAAALVLSLFRIRFVCMAYAAALLAVVKAAYTQIFVPLGWSAPWADEWIGGIDAGGLLALAGLLHLAEALLIRWRGDRMATPLFVESKRGKIVGAYHMFGLWVVPLLLLVPVPAGGLVLSWTSLFGTGVVDSGFTLPWTPLFGEGVAEAGWAFLPFPVLLGFTDQTLTALPVQKAKRSANWLFLYALVIMAAGIAAHYWEPLLILAALVAAGWHEGLIWRGRREEEARSPLYVHDDRGLKVLAVLPSSPAQNMNVQPGEIIRKVNGRLVRTKEELHQALQINPAFCKLEIINLDGEPRFANHPIYAGDHHQLGIILCPDDDVLYYMAEKRQTGLIAFIRRTLDGVVSNKQQQTM